MDFRANMMGDEADDPFPVIGGEYYSCIAKPFAEPVDPKTTAGIEHHFDDSVFVEPGRDVEAKRRAEHAGTALDRC